jgi:hypothetical protein
MQAPQVDDRFFPLVVNIIPERIQAEHLPDFFAKSEAVLMRREHYVTITDTSACRELPNAMVSRYYTANGRMLPEAFTRYGAETRIEQRRVAS